MKMRNLVLAVALAIPGLVSAEGLRDSLRSGRLGWENYDGWAYVVKYPHTSNTTKVGLVLDIFRDKNTVVFSLVSLGGGGYYQGDVALRELIGKIRRIQVQGIPKIHALCSVRVHVTCSNREELEKVTNILTDGDYKDLDHSSLKFEVDEIFAQVQREAESRALAAADQVNSIKIVP